MTLLELHGGNSQWVRREHADGVGAGHMFVTFRGRPGREGRCLEAIGPGCLCPTGKPCKLTEKSWQNSLTCGNFCAILGCYSRSKNCPHPTHLSPGGNCPSGHRRVRVCEWKPESSRCGIQLDTMERTRAFYRLSPPLLHAALTACTLGQVVCIGRLTKSSRIIILM